MRRFRKIISHFGSGHDLFSTPGTYALPIDFL